MNQTPARGFLVIRRRSGEKFIIDDKITITVIEIGRGRVRFAIDAPKEVKVQRQIRGQADRTPGEE